VSLFKADSDGGRPAAERQRSAIFGAWAAALLVLQLVRAH
jgi:hypothetical protein